MDPDNDDDLGFSRELDIHQRLDHPNIVRLLGTCFNGGFAYILTPLAPNGNLAQRLGAVATAAGAPPLTQNQRLNILLCTTRALRYMHELPPNGIWHR